MENPTAGPNPSQAGSPGFSWVRAYEEGSLTTMQLESLQAVVDSGEADSLLEAARLLDFQSTHRPGGEPGPQAY